MLTIDSFDWIFFDCFNTLIDDFDQTGHEADLAPMYQVPVDAGLYDRVDAVRQDYHRWRKVHISGQARELTIQERFRQVLQSHCPEADPAQVDTIVQQMADQFIRYFPKTLRLPAGVEAMLAHWHGRVRMGVVSNFFLAQWPEQCLEQYGLRHYFDFVLDSAACGWRKPGLPIYQAALALAELDQTARVLFVGDHLRNDVITPIDLGMQAVYFDRSKVRATSAPAPGNVCAIEHWDAFRD
jgi:putative hydrolase of the HAD superfamily